MKKLFVLLAFFTLCIAGASAQDNKSAGDAGKMIDKYKEKIKPVLMEKAKLTEDEADKVIMLHFQYAKRLQSFDGASEEEKKRQKDVIAAAENKEYAAIPLTEEKIKAVNEFWAEQQKRRQEAAKKTN